MFTKRAVAGLVIVSGLLAIFANSDVLFAQRPRIIVEERQGRTDPAKFKNPAGWSWLMRPRPMRVGIGAIYRGTSHIVKVQSYINVDDGSVRLWLIQAGSSEPPRPPKLRLVVLDEAGDRYLPEFKITGLTETRSEPDKTYLSESIFRLDPLVLDPKKVARVGVEEMVPEK